MDIPRHPFHGQGKTAKRGLAWLKRRREGGGGGGGLDLGDKTHTHGTMTTEMQNGTGEGHASERRSDCPPLQHLSLPPLGKKAKLLLAYEAHPAQT